MITFEIEIPFFGIYGHTAIVSYMLMSTGSQIEKRSLARVRIPDQSNVDSTALT